MAARGQRDGDCGAYIEAARSMGRWTERVGRARVRKGARSEARLLRSRRGGVEGVGLGWGADGGGWMGDGGRWEQGLN